jgi:hypothetical protein
VAQSARAKTSAREAETIPATIFFGLMTKSSFFDFG